MSRIPRRTGARYFLRCLAVLAGTLSAFTTAFAQASATGSVSGRVIDEGSGFGVSGADVTVVQTGESTTSDLSGAYVLSGLDAGSYTLSVSKDGYQPANITDLAIVAGVNEALDIPLGSVGGDIVKMEAFTVSADIVQSSDIGLLVARQKASSIGDAIGNEQFGRLAVGNAADALSKVTGASVVDGKYVLIRGLGDRYSNTLMNGFSVPSADPDRRAVQMDQFPADLVESIVTTKSFTPDQPGSFSGGSVNLKTKSFPDHFFASFSASAKYNSATTGEDMLVTQGGDRVAPDVSATLPSRTAAILSARAGNFEPAQLLDQATKSFSPAGFFPTAEKADPSTSFTAAIGSRIDFGDEGLFGYTASFNYDQSFSHYEGGEASRYLGTSAQPITRFALTTDAAQLSFDPTQVTFPAGTPPLGVTSSTVSETTGAFGKLAVRPTIDHEFSLDLFRNEINDDQVRRGVGEEVVNYTGSIFEVYDLLRTERAVSSAQLAGKSLFVAANELEVSWRVSYSESTQDQPDYRTLAAVYDFNGDFVNATSVQPNRFFRELTEEAREAGIDFTLPFSSGGREHRLKFGGMTSENERVYAERRFQYAVNPLDRNDLEQFPGDVGILSQTANSVTLGNTITRLQEPNNYDGDQKIAAAYAMIDYNVTDSLRAIFGARLETTEIETVPVEVLGLDPKTGLVDEDEVLPALNLVWAQNKRMNWRAAYGRTIARPTYKELTDIRYEDVFTGDVYLGNPDLELSVIDNFDLRWEWFPGKGETVAVSAFYKTLSNPIEVLYNPAVGSIQPQNVEEGTIYGLEFELRRNLKFLSEALSGFSFGGNVSFIHSEVTIPDAELLILRAVDPDASATRELLGQSSFVLNADLSWDKEAWGTAATLSYNVVGERLDLVNFGPLPDVFEQPAPLLNFVIAQRLSQRWKLKFSATNLLNPDREKSISTDVGTLYHSRYATGRSFSLSLSYLFE